MAIWDQVAPFGDAFSSILGPSGTLFLDFGTKLHFFVLDVIFDRPRPQGHQPEHTKGTQVTTSGPQP